MMTLANPVVVCASTATAISAVAAVWDIKSRRIPNLLTLPAFACALLLRGILFGWKEASLALVAGLLAGIVFFLFHIAGGMGAGDVKLITALAPFYGLAALPYLLIFTSIAGGVMAVFQALRHGRLRETFSNIGTLAVHHVQTGLTPHEDLNVKNGATLRLPYAIAIYAGCMLTNLIVMA